MGTAVRSSPSTMATAPSGTRSACRTRRSMCGATRVTAVPIALATRSTVLRDGGQRWSAFMSSSALRIWSFAYPNMIRKPRAGVVRSTRPASSSSGTTVGPLCTPIAR